jgi:predicted phosphodiesterase
MEPQLKIRLSLFAAISLLLASCSELLEPPEESVDERFRQSEIWDEDHPDLEISVQSNDYTILCGADSHVGNTNNLENFFKIASTTKVSAVLIAGDLTTGDDNGYALFEQYLPPKDYLPTFFTVGNHDLRSNGWDRFFSRFGASSYFFSINTPEGSDLYISLDSGSGTLGNDQLKWLENKLKNIRPGYRRCIVFTHTNFYNFRRAFISNPPVEELQVLMELFTKYRVDMLLTGHDHVRADEVFGITTYIIIGALTDEPGPGYVKLRITNGKIQYTFENLYN